jgi:hypothetical protein
MLDEGKEHGEASPTGETETARQKRGKLAKPEEPPKEDAAAKAGAEPAAASEKPVKAQGQDEAPDKAAAQTQSKPLSQAERMRFRRRR